MFCPNCGVQQPDNAFACSQCGAPLSGRPQIPQSVAPHPMQGGAQGGQLLPPPSYLAGAILVTLFCCLPFGIVSIVFASQVSGHIASGNLAAAQEASRKAATWMWWGFGIGLGINLLWVLFYGFAFLAAL